ncbi:hypothetical protein Poli38472_006780 [Pythium oligandrum]|uniref:Uncharacterized protein n=1 Tax=Pythium oligandrum TaxID=41045 RepID=A0A8K1C5F1_PYTOL|nr:hypothetical protein Poli38472_006780 [Pythium oligandrum]|eukprot:TMW56770.1 hypothetical protein Poli38472_006780 [Pythium oligandrum]
MASKGNERMLTFSAITEVTGTEAHEHVEEIEIVFAHYEDVEAQALRRCWGLKTLTLINCKLTRIPLLTLVRESLVHLCLSAQAITRMEALDLPHLRKLYLQQNLIERIEGLEQCRKLQTLWLYGNRITQIENLSSCSDLRELGLQDNLITTLQCEKGTGLNALVNLERLFLAKNCVRNVDDLQVLRQLPILHELSFSDAHFGSNPVVRHPEYRSLAMTSLRQLQSLDGIGIEDSERAVVVDAFLSKTLAFNDKIAELMLQYEHDMRTIETRKQRGRSNAEMLQRELVEALNDVEQCVLQGQKELEEEKERQIKLREQNTAMFAENVENLRSRWHEMVDQQLQEELQALEKEELLFDFLEQEAAAEESLALTIATLQCTHPDTIAFQHLPQHVPDYSHPECQWAIEAERFE